MFFASEKNVHIIVSLIKQHDIKNVVVSPGTSTIPFVLAVCEDAYFHVTSVVDERGAAFTACGIAIATGKPVVLFVTGNVASRDCAPALTEAFYSKLPILLVTQELDGEGYLYNNWPQVIDNRMQFNDIAKLSVHLPEIRSETDKWKNTLLVNRAIIELTKDGGGPTQIFFSRVSKQNSFVDDTDPQKISYVEDKGKLPRITAKRTAIYIGRHQCFGDAEVAEIEKFCEAYNGIVFCDQTSNYYGKYRIQPPLLWSQRNHDISGLKDFELMIHIGGITGSYIIPKPKEVWRVAPDGQIADGFQKLSYVVRSDEMKFFEYINSKTPSQENKDAANSHDMEFYNAWDNALTECRRKVTDIPFSNAWMAKETIPNIPIGSVVYLSILNTLRCWNLFETNPNVKFISNTGAFGTDGSLSTTFGMSIADPERIHFCVVGDLSFFYDLNCIGNRDIPSNLRIMLVNNGMGTEFKNYGHEGHAFGDLMEPFVAAAGHFGNKSREYVRHMAEDLGFLYLCAEDKGTYRSAMRQFWTEKKTEQPILLEAFTNSGEESLALETLYNLYGMEEDRI